MPDALIPTIGSSCGLPLPWNTRYTYSATQSMEISQSSGNENKCNSNTPQITKTNFRYKAIYHEFNCLDFEKCANGLNYLVGEHIKIVELLIPKFSQNSQQSGYLKWVFVALQPKWQMFWNILKIHFHLPYFRKLKPTTMSLSVVCDKRKWCIINPDLLVTEGRAWNETEWKIRQINT